MNESDFTRLPPNLPIPADDGACGHLCGLRLPDMALPKASGGRVNLSVDKRLVVLFVYPLSGRPGFALPSDWDTIPGARGCTPEACSFKDHHAEIRRLGAEVFGLSVQSGEYQREFQGRMRLPFELLSDEDFAFSKMLALPTFTVGSLRLLKRLTLISIAGVIKRVFYPVFPPDEHAADVVSYLKNRQLPGTPY